jgi:hypothetical protein
MRRVKTMMELRLQAAGPRPHNASQDGSLLRFGTTRKEGTMWKRPTTLAAILCLDAVPALADPTWNKASPGAGGAFLCVDVESNGKVLAGSDVSGAYRRDGTGNWTRLGKRDGINATSIECVKWKPGRSDIALMGTRNGLYLSTDSAKTWSQMDFNNKIVTALGWKDDTVYAVGATSLTQSDIILMKSVDNGSTWGEINTNGFAGNLRAVKLAVNPLSADTVWLLSGNDRSSKQRAKELWKTANGGVNWQKKSGSYNAIDVALPASGRPLLMATSKTGAGGDDDSGSVVRSTDGSGTTWTAGTFANGSQATGALWWDGATAYLINVQADACGSSPFSPISGKFSSSDGGATWAKVDSGGSWEVAWTDCSHARGRALSTVAKTLSAKGEYWVSAQFAWHYASGAYENAFSTSFGSGDWLTKGIDNAVPTAMTSSGSYLYAGYYDVGIWTSVTSGQRWRNINPSGIPGWNGYGGNVTGIVADGSLIVATMARTSKADTTVISGSDATDTSSTACGDQPMLAPAGLSTETATASVIPASCTGSLVIP